MGQTTHKIQQDLYFRRDKCWLMISSYNNTQKASVLNTMFVAIVAAAIAVLL